MRRMSSVLFGERCQPGNLYLRAPPGVEQGGAQEKVETWKVDILNGCRTSAERVKEKGWGTAFWTKADAPWAFGEVRHTLGFGFHNCSPALHFRRGSWSEEVRSHPLLTAHPLFPARSISSKGKMCCPLQPSMASSTPLPSSPRAISAHPAGTCLGISLFELTGLVRPCLF